MPYTILPHTADLRIRAKAPSREALFREMMRGMFAAMQPEVDEDAKRAVRTVKLSAQDIEALLIDFLNEALTLAETKREVYDDVSFATLGAKALEAECIGRERDTIRLEVKAATHHDVVIRQEDDVWEATVVFDI